MSIVAQHQESFNNAWKSVLECREQNVTLEVLLKRLMEAENVFKAIADLPRGPTTSLKLERVISQAQVKLALLLCQTRQYTKAAHYISLLGYHYRLSDEVWETNDNGAAPQSSSPFCTAYDQTLPVNTLGLLKDAFVKRDTYWAEHQYSDGTLSPPSPYFSYYCSIDAFLPQEGNVDPGGVFGVYVRRMFELAKRKFPQVEGARYVEFWAHHRRNVMSGHQFHFDSDCEGEDGVRNPLASTVLYLDGCGGPTLVTDQLLSAEEVHNKGWMVFPAENRSCVFNGSVLHGVVPGNPTWSKNSCFETNTSPTRTTLMVAFWKDLACAHKPSSQSEQDRVELGACMPMPFQNNSNDSSSENNKTWHLSVLDPTKVDEGSSNMEGSDSVTEEITPYSVEKVWVDVDENANMKENRALVQMKRLPDYSYFFQGF